MRPTWDEYFIEMVRVVATRGSCARRQVGCVLVDKMNRVVAMGYNGPARGLPHCTQGSPCPGANCPSGEGLDLCQAIHAEQNALLYCKDVYEIHTAYVSCFPCVSCLKLLLNTGCQKIVAAKPYAHDEHARKFWEEAGREYVILTP